jgi:hypothetical protein
MPLVRCSAKTLAAMAGDGTLMARLAERFAVRYGHSAASSEIASWERSLPVLAHDLIDAGLGDVEVLVEYRLPQNSKRADVVLCGTHPMTGADSYVVVELKQWTSASEFDGDDPAQDRRRARHPCQGAVQVLQRLRRDGQEQHRRADLR